MVMNRIVYTSGINDGIEIKGRLAFLFGRASLLYARRKQGRDGSKDVTAAKT